ncbi:MAG: hypothetical protein J0L98_21365, partial [Zoogloea sp.]|nr:hypothetical protein [Zoogloea sp.]
MSLVNLWKPLRRLARCGLVGVALLAMGPAQGQSSSDTRALYQQHCATCHGEQRSGGMGPA